MNKFITAIKSLDIAAIEQLLAKHPELVHWQEDDGKNALHYLCGVVIAKHLGKEVLSLQMLKLFIDKGMAIDAVHQIKDGCGSFPARPVWYAYTRGRNKTLYSWLLQNGANPQNCMFAIVWYDDAEAAVLFKQHGADIDDSSIGVTPLLSAVGWKRFVVTEWLLQNGANVNAADSKGNTSLHIAVKQKYPLEFIKLLLQHGADSSLQNNEGASPKSMAARQRPDAFSHLFV
ncbi:ankyrin repeat domain-containing protein [Mucilaginibacter pedocola]|uniref:Uncharacterized protein n=1 Tax=Mucilaginibacter pedocola TaxID=1792845 RepID=A0A1S9PI82_9SPHI|nr:ankyrin repeat domain-containing protein [Mucilaginibacter pedocola]OOQ60659.1 hypothetical protein BC343_23980 [Mucilaginibacter pedocola]